MLPPDPPSPPSPVLSELTAQIVAAHVSNNPVATADLPALIQSVYRSLAGAQTALDANSAEANKEPAVAIKQSVKPDAIVCLECGKHFKMLKRHLNSDHNLGIVEYRNKWRLPTSYPMVAPNYATVRSKLAKRIGLGKLHSQAITVRKSGKGRR